MTFNRLRLLYVALLLAHIIWRSNDWLSAALVLCAIWLVAWMVDNWREAKKTA